MLILCVLSAAELVRHRMFSLGYRSPEDLVHEALEALAKKKPDSDIAEGLADIEAGRYKKLTDDNMEAIAKSIVAKSLQ